MLNRILCVVMAFLVAKTTMAENIRSVISYYQPEMARGFIFISKTDMTLTLVDSLGHEVVSYPMACGRNKGQKHASGDNRTPEGYFLLQNVQDASSWGHDFGDGKGFIKHAYGPYFMRLQTGFRGIGIHGTHAPESIGTRASEGCIRLENKNVADLEERVEIGMPVIIGPEEGVETLIAANVPRPNRKVWTSGTAPRKRRPAKPAPVVEEPKLAMAEAPKPSPVSDPVAAPRDPVIIQPVENVHGSEPVIQTNIIEIPTVETAVEAPKVEAPVMTETPEQTLVAVKIKELEIETQSEEPMTEVKTDDSVVETKTEEPAVETQAEEPLVETQTEESKEELGYDPATDTEIKYEVIVEEVVGPDGEVKFEVKYVRIQ